MDTISQLIFNGLEWLNGRLEIVTVALAALSLSCLMVPLRGISLVAIACVAGGAALVYGGVGELTVAVLLIGSNCFLLAIEAGAMRRRLHLVEETLASVAKAVRGLEVAQERRQGFIARQMPWPIAGLPDNRKPDRGASSSGLSPLQSPARARADEISDVPLDEHTTS